jgi:hypothetical protein
LSVAYCKANSFAGLTPDIAVHLDGSERDGRRCWASSVDWLLSNEVSCETCTVSRSDWPEITPAIAAPGALERRVAERPRR